MRHGHKRAQALREALRRLAPATPILIAGDNDKLGAGQRYATKTAEAVTDCTAIWPEAEGEDFNDLAKRAGLGAVASRLNGTPTRAPLIASPYDWTDPASIQARRWLYGHHLIRAFVSATIAPGGVGKSSLVIAEALAMVTGRKLLHHDVRGGPHRVWLFNLEDPLEELQRRIQATAQHFGITREDIAGRLFVNSGRDRDLVVATETREGVRLIEPEIDALVHQIRTNQIDAVIVDPFVSSHDVTENDNRAIDKVVKGAWLRVATQTDCAIDLVHHTGKMRGGEVTSDSSRGASSLVSAARDARALNPMQPDEAKFFGIETHRGHFRVYSDKANLAPPAERSDWYKTESVELANGDWVGVVTKWKPAGLFDRWNKATLNRVLRAFGEGRYRVDPRSPDWAGHMLKEELGIEDNKTVKEILARWEASGRIVQIDRDDDQRRSRKCYAFKADLGE